MFLLDKEKWERNQEEEEKTYMTKKKSKIKGLCENL